MQITDAYRTVSRFVHNVTNAADDLGFVAGDITVKGDVVAVTLTDKLEKYEPLIVEFKGEGGAREVNGALACELMAKGVRWVAATPEPEARWCILNVATLRRVQRELTTLGQTVEGRLKLVLVAKNQDLVLEYGDSQVKLWSIVVPPTEQDVLRFAVKWLHSLKHAPMHPQPPAERCANGEV